MTSTATAKQLRDKSVQKIKKALELYNAGKSMEEIAAELDISVRQVRRLLTAGGIKLVIGKKPKLLDSELPALYEKIQRRETSYDVIASEFGVAIQTVKARMKKYNDKRRIDEAQRRAGKAERVSDD